ncbi:MAG: ATPase [Flavobacteriales bacterium]|nr:ATPase [Flavobacteriales bacterium]
MEKYKVIADSGSTKTDWVIIDQKGEVVEKIKTIGFNPYFQTSEQIFNELLKCFNGIKINFEQITNVFYYGAGCSSEEKNMVVKIALQPHFLKAQININHDLIAAARSTLANSDGIACILGTGANSCIWEDGKEVENIASHGYIFGDEGSGSYLGIQLIKLYLSGGLGKELTKSFEEEFKLTKDQILNNTYREKSPNVFLASFATFYHSRLHYPELRKIVYDGFNNFFKVRVVPYENYQKYSLGFVGSIAFFYKDVLTEVAEHHGMKIHKITRCPIDQLTIYHSRDKVTA